MKDECRNCEEKQACVPFFVHENSLMHYSRVNKRMMILFIVGCATVALIIGIFVHGNTIREKQLIDMVDRLVVEVQHGVHEQQNP